MIRSASSWVVSTRFCAAFMQSARLVSRAGDRDDLLATVARALVAGQGPGPADVTLAGARAVRRERGVDAVGTDQEVGHLLGRRGGQGDQPAARTDRRQQVLDGRRAEHPHRAIGGLLDRLEQGVGGLLGEPVGVLDDHHLPAAADRGQRRTAYQVAHLVDADREPIGADDGDVGVAAGQDRCGTSGRCRSPAAAPRTAGAAANATAAFDRPDPGGPVNRNAWLMPWPEAAARSDSTARR